MRPLYPLNYWMGLSGGFVKANSTPFFFVDQKGPDASHTKGIYPRSLIKYLPTSLLDPTFYNASDEAHEFQVFLAFPSFTHIGRNCKKRQAWLKHHTCLSNNIGYLRTIETL